MKCTFLKKEKDGGITYYDCTLTDISMKFVDYFNRIPNGMLEGVACKECWDKVLANVQASQEYCISKRNQAEKGWTK